MKSVGKRYYLKDSKDGGGHEKVRLPLIQSHFYLIRICYLFPKCIFVMKHIDDILERITVFKTNMTR